MTNKIIKIFSIVAMLAFASCDDYLDVNENPNRALIDDIPPTLRLSAAQTASFRSITGDNQNFETSIRTTCLNQLGNIWMNSWAGNSNNTTGANADEYGVILTSAFYDNIWDYTYRSVSNFQSIIDFESLNYDNHKAISMIMKVFYMQYIVDLYGDCPYTEALKYQANLAPSYDDDQVIYRTMYDELDGAIALINNADTDDAVVGAEDAMLGGNMAEWIKFANTIKLRLLIRQSDLGDTATQTYIDTKLTDLGSQMFIDADITINPGYNNATADNQNPMYGSIGYDIAGNARSSRTYITASRHAQNALNGAVTGVVDPRRGRLFTLQGGAVVGIDQGEDSSAAPDNPSFLGPAIIPVPVSGNSSVGSSMDGYVMTLSEAKFLLAEAVYKYPSKFPGYDAQTLFNEGITSSFTRLGAALGTYLTDIDSVGGYGWTATSDKVEAIMTQKWLALMNIHGIESWIDHLRTGYPVVPLPITNTTGRPKRLMYPTSEYVANSANVPALSASQAFATGPFWIP